MKKNILLAISLVASLAGCVTQPVTAPAYAQNQVLKITGIGYGAMSNYEGYTPGQKRLMAMRASKLDAYRSLAEQVYGVHLTGNTTVSAMTTQNDGYRAYVDATIRGARIVSITPMADGNYETVLELYVQRGVFNSQGQLQAPAAGCSMAIGSNGIGCAAPAGNQFYYME